ncbi:LysR family transcriptional regulator [Rhodanobacter sp. MP7CTX1]|uniref:LysR family transcriptional regulator n=1 Tax=Rhodanobacter sp. MP7CTX1 TaxID=2723084 RepID=UPI001615DC45|nr:LysR family transcriptional regulator [Rhodanobacter sp. MP7CTX1]MBB6189536.1 DNA-binding transcriptional LysR family regulator [Rhodanobacter sp. MP7CTX1]
MDRLDVMRLFTRIVERQSFTQAAQDLELPRSTATQAIKELEKRLGVRLLQRTTRNVRSTLDGEAFYKRCVAILGEVEDAEAVFSNAKPRGLLRVDVHGTLARHFVLPALPAFLAEYPDLQLHLGESDRLVDLVREGVDCVLRAGDLKDSAMVGRRVALLEEVTCASPDYLARYGTPATFDDLHGHVAIGFMSSATGTTLPLEFLINGERRNVVLPATLTVTAAETYAAAARLGLGLIQMPRYHIDADLKAGILVKVLAEYPPAPTPVSLLYPHSRQLSSRVRVFIDWLTRELASRA